MLPIIIKKKNCKYYERERERERENLREWWREFERVVVSVTPRP
jgi:hypothetical protein